MFVGREHELSLIGRHLEDNSKAQLIILYGRRRIGKSTLIAKAVEQESNVLFFEGIEGARTQIQIAQFLGDLAAQTGRMRLDARNWRDVFQGLGELLRSGRWVLVFDEFPWLGAGRTQIVSELKLYWDRWSKNPDLCLFLCGSVASFMTNHVVHSKAFHNRKTLELCLGPLTPRETSRFIPRRSAREKAQLYMCLGGVPKYLEQLDARQSLEKNLNRLCFSSGGFFVEEYETLFKEQFRSLKVYESIAESLSKAPASLSELARRVRATKGGGFHEQVANLVRAQFVREYVPVKLGGQRRARTRLYKLSDPFLIFYFRYIHPNREIINRNRRGENLFRAIAGSSIQQYYSYAFERLCEDGMDAILERLDIVLADIVEMGPFFQQSRGQQDGLQIDWMILRRDSGECAILSWKLKRLPTPWFDDVGKNNIKPQEKGAEMGSLLRTAKKHKKSRRLGEPEVMAREEYGELEVDVKIEMIRLLIPLGLMHVHELLDDEVKELAGERYARKDELERGRRHGTNPGTVGLAGQRVPIRVPRVRSQEGVEIPLCSYEALNDGGEVNDLLLKRVLYGISCRNYEAAAEAIPGAIGLSSSTVSRGFVQASAAKLREMQERDLSGEDVVALFLDGKSFADAMMVIALGITLSGEKRFLGFVETDTENEKVLTPFLRSLLARGLDSSQGLLVIIDGGKGLKAAVKKAFRKRVLIQRCQWHKRENVVSYLSKGEQASLRKRLQSAYNRPEYKEALAALDQLHDELEERNQSAAGSLEEGIEETLTLHRLGVYGVLGRSFKTTNCLESVNALVEERCAKVDHWKNSSQRQRWLATALVDIEPRLRRVIGYRHLPKLREALKRELKIETKTSTVSKKKAA